MIEEPFFFTSNNYRLFGMHYYPDNNIPEVSRVGLVLCDPFAEEKLWSHRFYVTLARHLANNGIWVMRFDCMGHGDSEGNFEDSSVKTRIEDTINAVNMMINKFNLNSVGLLGARFGGSIAALVSNKSNVSNFLIMINPIVDGDRYFKECLRSNIATQLSTFGKVIYNREQLLENLKKGIRLNIDGYIIGNTFCEEIRNMNLLKDEIVTEVPALIVYIDKDGDVNMDSGIYKYFIKYSDKSSNVKLINIVEELFWKEIKTYFNKSLQLNDRILEFIKGI